MSALATSKQGNLVPAILPRGWREAHSFPGQDAFVYRDGLGVIVTSQAEQDGKLWLHVSISRADRLPSWADLKAVKDIFIGEDKLAVQVLPKATRFINIHPRCLHLWHCLDGDPVPDFAWGGNSI